jgi:hypothetical protein
MRNPDPHVSMIGRDLRHWAMPEPGEIKAKHRDNFVRRCGALNALAGGATIRDAARSHKLHRDTVTQDAKRALERLPDGSELGYRACLPWRHRKLKADVPDLPITVAPHALSKLLLAVPGLAEITAKYAGALPKGRRKCRQFDQFFRQWLAEARQATQGRGFPCEAPDSGRRALRQAIAAERRRRREAEAPAIEEEVPRITRLGQLFKLAPLERVEFDAHKIDLDQEIEVPRPDVEDAVPRKVACLTLLVLIDAVSRYLIHYVLLLGAYTHVDVLRLFHRALRPWRPRELIVPGLEYPPEGTVGLPIDDDVGPRALLIAGDNAAQHHTETTIANLLQEYGGILHYGKSHVPEARPIVEAFNRRVEEGALRWLPGGFQPVPLEGPTPTAYGSPRAHPLHWEGLCDLMDVLAAGYNVTPHSGLGQRRPVDVLQAHLRGGGWHWRSAGAAQDATRLTTRRLRVTIRGGASTGKAPYIQWEHGIYRSQRLLGARNRVGSTLAAEVDLEDCRFLNVLEDGQLWSRMRALPPWDRTPHDLTLRRHIVGAKQRGLLELTGARDAVDCYREFAKHQSRKSGTTTAYADLVTRGLTRPATPKPKLPPLAITPTSFAHFKD